VNRNAAIYTSPGQQPAVDAWRAHLHRYVHPGENAANLTTWRRFCAREHIWDLSRQAVVDHLRDRFWIRDTTPAREEERQASVARKIAAEHRQTGRPVQGPRRPNISFPLQGLAALLQQTTRVIEQDAVGGKLHIQLFT